MAGVDERVKAVHAVAAFGDDGVVHQQDGVFGGNPHQHDEADHRRHADAAAEDEQPRKRAANGERERHEDGEGLQHAVEEQHEDGIDAEDADAHRQDEAAEQFFHHFCLADVVGAYRGRQILHGRGIAHGVGEFAQRAAPDLYGDHDFARAFVAGDGCRATGEGETGNVADARLAVDGQIFQRRQIGARRFRQADDDRQLAAVEIEFGEALFVVALGGDAQGVRQLQGGNATVGHFQWIGVEAQFFAREALGAGHAARVGQGADVAHQRLRGLIEDLRIVAGERDDIARRAAVTEPHGKTRPGDVFQPRLDFALNRAFARPGAARREDEFQVGAVPAFAAVAADVARQPPDGAEDVGNARHVGNRPPRRLAYRQRVFQRRIRRQLDADAALVHIIIRHERAGQMPRERQGKNKQRDGDSERRPAPAQGKADKSKIRAHQGAVAPHHLARLRLQHISRHHWRYQTGDGQREKHRNRRRPAELAEKLTDDATHERRRQKNCNQRKRRGDDRETNLVRRLHRRLIRRLAAAQMADDILNLHNRIIDQHANHQRQREQRNNVQTKTQQPHHQKRRNHRQRQRHGGDQRRPPIPQKHKNHHHRQQPALNQHIERILIILLDRCGAVIHLGNPELRKIRLNTRKLRLNRVHHPDLARAPAAHHLKRHHRLAIKQRMRIRLRRTIAHRGKIPQPLRPTR